MADLSPHCRLKKTLEDTELLQSQIVLTRKEVLELLIEYEKAIDESNQLWHENNNKRRSEYGV